MSEIAEPMATLYIYRLNGRAVAMAIGQFPPDPLDLRYDSLVRIPIMKNGDRPSWQTFIWRPGESINNALKRAGNPIRVKVPRPTLSPRQHKPRRYAGRGKPRACPPEPQPAPKSSNEIPRALGALPGGRRITRDPRTGEFVVKEAANV